MKKYILTLVSLLCISKIVTASSELNHSVLREILEYAAHMEFGYAENAGEDAVNESAYLNSAESALSVAYQFLRNSQKESQSEIDDQIVAYTLSRVGWFFLQKRNPDFPQEVSVSLIREAYELEPDNNVYKYMYSKASNLEEGVKEQILEEILQNDPSFMEAISDLLRIRLRQKNFESADSLRIQYLKNLENFHPQLWHFDHSYPPKLAHIVIEKGKRLERKAYNRSFERFKYNPNQNR